MVTTPIVGRVLFEFVPRNIFRYQSYLNERGEIDYSDMILQATDLIKQKNIKANSKE